MADRYLELTRSAWAAGLVDRLGLPNPPSLSRATEAIAEHPFSGCAAIVGAAPGARVLASALQALTAAGAEPRGILENGGIEWVQAAAVALNIALKSEAPDEGAKPPSLLVFDASGIETPQQLRRLFDFFQPRMASLPSNSRVVILGGAIDFADAPAAVAARMALHGFVRSLAKEMGRRGSTVNLLEVAVGGEELIAGPLRFLLSDHAAFVTGQVLPVASAPAGILAPGQFAAPLRGRSVVVTGAARGIGAAISRACVREGALLVGLDRTQEEEALGGTMSALDALGLPLDITAPDAAKRIADEVGGRFGGIDLLVHNAGVTRDKTLKNMSAAQWDQVMDVNLIAIVNTTQKLLDAGVLREGARIVCISSINGIAGSPGQTNYAASKAGILGYVEAMASGLAAKGLAINAIAPGFIETGMTAAMPTMTREVGRRLSALAQGGLPEDVAEAVVFLGSPGAAGVNGRYLRVCGLNFVGA